MSHEGNEWIAEKEHEEFGDVPIHPSFMSDAWECPLCKRITTGYGNGGDPLTDKQVCNDCNRFVIVARYHNGSQTAIDACLTTIERERIKRGDNSINKVS